MFLCNLQIYNFQIGTSFRRKRNALEAKISKERKNHWKNVPTAAEKPLNCSFMEQLILESIARAVVLAAIAFVSFRLVENALQNNTTALSCTYMDPLMKVTIKFWELNRFNPFTLKYTVHFTVWAKKLP